MLERAYFNNKTRTPFYSDGGAAPRPGKLWSGLPCLIVLWFYLVSGLRSRVDRTRAGSHHSRPQAVEHIHTALREAADQPLTGSHYVNLIA